MAIRGDQARDLPSAITHHWLNREELSASLLRLTDFGLMAVIFLAPLFMGGRHPFGRFVFISIACFTAVAWMLRTCFRSDEKWRLSGAEGVLLAGLLLIVIQLFPLPHNMLHWLSPNIAELLPLWSSETETATGFSSWSQITLTPQDTGAGLVLFLAYGMLFLVVVQRIRSLDDIERLLCWIAAAVVGMSAVGLVQFLLGNGNFLWLYEHPSRTADFPVKGTFANQNHFAHFLALGMGPLIWLICRRDSKRKQRTSLGLADRVSLAGWHQYKRPALIIAVGIVAFAGLLSFSRGGVIVLLLAALTCILIHCWAGLIGKQALLAAGGIGGVVAIALLIYGYRPLMEELGTLHPNSAKQFVEEFGRFAIWKADFKAVRDFPFLGTGIGSHREVYPTYFEEFATVEFSHAESGYLQVLLETGIVGLGLLLVGIALTGLWVFRGLHADSSRCVACAAAIFAGLLISIIHSIWDFVWYIPACMSFTVILLACACRLSQLVGHAADQAVISVPSGARIASALVLFFLAMALIQNDLKRAVASLHWDRYRRIALNQPDALPTAPDQQLQQIQSVDVMIGHLTDLLESDPDDARAHLRLAQQYLTKFELLQKAAQNPMPLAHIRDAATASQFPSREALNNWLDVAVGAHRTDLDRALSLTRRALTLSPLQGEGYALLAELVFLEGKPDRVKQQYVAQAVKLRPHSGRVLLAAGSEAALQGEPTQALKYWKAAFQQDPRVRGKLIELLAAQLPAEVFVEEFAPDTHAMQQLYQRYRSIGRQDQARVISPQIVEALVRKAQRASDAAAAILWWNAYTILAAEDRFEQAIVCARNALQLLPHDFRMRRSFAQFLLKQERDEEAIEHLQWCVRRASGDKELQVDLELAIDRVSKRTRVSAVPSPVNPQAASYGTK